MVDVAAPGGDAGEDADSDGFPDGVLSTIGSDRDGTVTYGYRRYEDLHGRSPCRGRGDLDEIGLRRIDAGSI